MVGKEKGQSLLELAIFGALFLVFLGALISYGLKYNYQQHAMQRAFRKALYYSNVKQQVNKGSANYLSIEDRHIPDPLDTFGVGVVSTYQASASLTRNYKMDETADDITSLPSIAIDFKGMSVCPGSGGPPWATQPCSGCGSDSTCLNNCRLSPAGSNPPCFYLTAGFAIDTTDGDRRIFLGDAATCPNNRSYKLRKYEFVFGSSNVQKFKDNSNIWVEGEDDDEDWNGLISVIDSCEGEILDYSDCKRQCNLITDSEYCKRICDKQKYGNCGLCDAQIQIPWYCDRLNQIFQQTKDNLMGIQNDNIYTSTRKENRMRKTETMSGMGPGLIRTRDSFDWEHIMGQMIIFRPYGVTTGDTETQQVQTTVEQDEAHTWSTPW